MDLINYLRKQLAAGYDLATLRNALMQYGYSHAVIDDAIKQLHGPQEIKHTIHFSKSSFGIAVGSISAIVIIVGMVLFFVFNSTPELLDVRVSAIKSEVEAGGNLDFGVEIFNLGAKRTYDVELKYEIVDQNKNVISMKEETIALQTKISTTSTINVPRDTPKGSYMLEVRAMYSNKIARASSSFIVYAEATCAADCRGKSCGDDGCGGSCGVCQEGADCDDYRCIVKVISPEAEPEAQEPEKEEDAEPEREPDAEPGEEGEPGEKSIEEIKDISASDFSRAIDECEGLSTTANQDLCYLEISSAADNKDSCQHIISNIQKDQCYMNWALNNNDYSICEELNNENLKDSCELLRG